MRSDPCTHALYHPLEFLRCKHVIRSRTAIAAGLSTTVLLSGCGVLVALAERDVRANAFVYQGKTYDTRAEAEAAYKAHLRDVLNQVERLRDPVAGRARIIVPTKDAILQRQRTIGGVEVNDYRATVLSDHIRMHASAIEIRNLFSQREIVETSQPDHVAPTPDMAIIYLYMAPAGEWSSWYYVSQTMPRTPLDPEGARNTTKWMKAFLIDLEAVARKDKTEQPRGAVSPNPWERTL